MTRNANFALCNIIQHHKIIKYWIGQALVEDLYQTRILKNFLINEMIGSRWIAYVEAEELYKKYKILEPENKIILYVQEIYL